MQREQVHNAATADVSEGVMRRAVYQHMRQRGEGVGPSNRSRPRRRHRHFTARDICIECKPASSGPRLSCDAEDSREQTVQVRPSDIFSRLEPVLRRGGRLIRRGHHPTVTTMPESISSADPPRISTAETPARARASPYRFERFYCGESAIALDCEGQRKKN